MSPNLWFELEALPCRAGTVLSACFQPALSALSARSQPALRLPAGTLHRWAGKLHRRARYRPLTKIRGFEVGNFGDSWSEIPKKTLILKKPLF